MTSSENLSVFFLEFSVFEILLKVSEGKSWKDTLLEVLPQRKFKMPNYPNQKRARIDNGTTGDESLEDQQDQEDKADEKDREDKEDLVNNVVEPVDDKPEIQ